MPPYARILSIAGLAAALVTVLAGAQARQPPGPPPVPRARAASQPVAADSFTSARTYQAVAAPVRLRIPAIRVNSRLDRLGQRRDGTVAEPRRMDVAGWYERGPRPGQPGPAVILGHVDSRTGPGVFIDLATVRTGTLVQVDRADGSTVTFRVTRVVRIPKNRFPTDLVYAPTLDPTLRLVTCGGSFDHARGHYRDNVIAFADLV